MKLIKPPDEVVGECEIKERKDDSPGINNN